MIPRRRAAHAATRGRSEAWPRARISRVWPRQAQRGPTALLRPGAPPDPGASRPCCTGRAGPWRFGGRSRSRLAAFSNAVGFGRWSSQRSGAARSRLAIAFRGGSSLDAPERRATHAATRGRSEAWPRARISRVWPRQAQRGPTALSGPGVGPLQELLDSAFGHTDHSGDPLHRQGRNATLPKTSRTRRHTRLKRHQVVPKPAVARLWPNKRLIAYLARAFWSTEKFGPALSTSSIASASRAWPAASMAPRTSRTRGHTRRSEARWHGDGQEPGYRACGRDKPNVGLPPGCRPAPGASRRCLRPHRPRW
jgi:transposase